jgi:hypothetical protein
MTGPINGHAGKAAMTSCGIASDAVVTNRWRG